ncbi:hypothetical protein [Cupriavidus necator]
MRQIYSKDETFRAMVQYLPCKSERTAEDLRTELAQARSEARDAAVAQARAGPGSRRSQRHWPIGSRPPGRQ